MSSVLGNSQDMAHYSARNGIQHLLPLNLLGSLLLVFLKGLSHYRSQATIIIFESFL